MIALGAFRLPVEALRRALRERVRREVERQMDEREAAVSRDARPSAGEPHSILMNPQWRG
ncbi:hypothetical protein [Aureimonas ureilytica]|uniref:hypothetical protein n=1 Tax=Aureimonas ureilytica TaxID=401562 RepID=UPI000362399D|nr:hypothetical protein [Aureimonas ureilytica]